MSNQWWQNLCSRKTKFAFFWQWETGHPVDKYYSVAKVNEVSARLLADVSTVVHRGCLCTVLTNQHPALAL